MNKIIFAVDPGTGVSSPAGICIYCPNTDKILFTTELWPDKTNQKPTWRRLLDMINQMKTYLDASVKKYGPLEVRTERFVMVGKGGETLARFAGGLLASISWECTFVEVHNIILKKDITGNAKASKQEIGAALEKRFAHDADSLDTVRKLIHTSKWDQLDAIAIAVCRIVDGAKTEKFKGDDF